MDSGVIVAGILNGAISGALYGFSGYMVLGHDEPFDGPKFLRALLIGVAVGVLSFMQVIPLPIADNQIHAWLGMGAISGFLDQFTVWLWQRIKGKKPWKGGPTVEEIAPKAVEGVGMAMKRAVEETPVPPENPAQVQTVSLWTPPYTNTASLSFTIPNITSTNTHP